MHDMLELMSLASHSICSKRGTYRVADHVYRIEMRLYVQGWFFLLVHDTGCVTSVVPVTRASGFKTSAISTFGSQTWDKSSDKKR